MNVLIAGGTGLIGSRLSERLLEAGHQVRILTRKPVDENHVHWDPSMEQIDVEQIMDTQVLINLCGAGIADKRWTNSRKEELINSRIEPIHFLAQQSQHMPNLKQFISASGITCYGFENRENPYRESDPYGDTFIDQVVRRWEESADQFSSEIPVTTLRIAIVLSSSGGAIEQMLRPIRWNMGAVIGHGNQWIPWVHLDDLCDMFDHVMQNELEGVYNTAANCATNRELTTSLAKLSKKRLWLPRIPAFMIRLIFGEMSTLLNKGVRVSNERIRQTGYRFKYDDLDQALSSLKLH